MAEAISVPDHPAGGDYSTAVRRRDGVVQLSGLNGSAEGRTPADATAQADLIVDQLEAILAAADLHLADVFSLRIYATSREALHAWRTTAAVMRDPLSRAILTGPLHEDDFVDAPEPGRA